MNLDEIRARQVEAEHGLAGDELVTALDRRARAAEAEVEDMRDRYQDLRERHGRLARLLVADGVTEAASYLEAIGS